MREYDLKIEWLSKYRYRELKNMCLQYRETKQQIASMSVLSAARISGQPSGGGKSDPVAAYVLRLEHARSRIEAIEQAAIAAAPGFYRELLLNVTEGIPFQCLNVPCDRKYFYRARRKFFLILDKWGTTG